MAVTEKEPVLKIRMLKNVTVTLPNAPVITVPMSMREVPTQHGPAAVPQFDVGENSIIHEIPLQDENAYLPKRRDGMSKRFHEEACDAAYKRASDAGEKNRELREELAVYVKRGVIQIVDDPFAHEYMSDEDVAASEREPSSKPSKIRE